MSRKLVLYSFVFLWGGCGVCAAQAMFSTEREFGPVRFSQEQLLELVDRLQVFAERLGSTTGESDDVSQTLSLSDGQSTLVISEAISVETLGSAPPVATSVSYRYLNRLGVIRSIDVRFNDARRVLEISGRSRDQVEAAANLAGMIIRQSETTLGGLTHRTLLGGLLLAVGFMLVASAGNVVIDLTLTPPVRRALALTGLMLSLSVWLLPWEEWVLGTVIYRGDASFLVRHAALISFLGFLATIFTFFHGVVRIAHGSLKSQVETEVAPRATEDE